jgi:hypothetical protein
MKKSPLKQVAASLLTAACVGAIVFGAASTAQAADDLYYSGSTAPGSTHHSVKRVAIGGTVTNLGYGINYIQSVENVGSTVSYRAYGTGTQILTHGSFNSVSTCFWLQDPNPNVPHPSAETLFCRQRY